MKHASIKTAVAIVLLASMSAISHSQTSVHRKIMANTIAGMPLEEKEVNMKIVRRFRKTFPYISNTSWNKTNGHYFVRFTEGGIKNKISFTIDGNVDYSLKIFTENQMPVQVRQSIKGVYYDFSISSAQELKVNRNTIYLVQITDSKSWKTVRLCDGDLEEIESLVKE